MTEAMALMVGYNDTEAGMIYPVSRAYQAARYISESFIPVVFRISNSNTSRRASIWLYQLPKLRYQNLYSSLLVARTSRHRGSGCTVNLVPLPSSLSLSRFA